MEALTATLDDEFVVFHSVAWHAKAKSRTARPTS